MKRNISIAILIVFTLSLIACGAQSSTTDNIMNIPTDKIASILLYSEGTSTEVAADSEEFLSLTATISENEEKSTIIDGGLGIDMAGINAADYSEYSKKEAVNIYIISFSDMQQITYGEYDSKKANITGIFIIPEKGYFGTIIKNSDTGDISYATFMNLEEDIF